MNKIFKVIYNKSKGCYTVVSELAKGKTKSQSRKTKTALTMAVVLGLSVGFMGTTFADGINISQTNNDGTVQQGNTMSGTNKILVGTTIEPHSTSANSETGSIAIGDKIAYGGDRSIAIGTGLKTSNDNSILIGSDMIGDAYSKQVIAIGNKIGNKDENNGTYNLGNTQRLIAIGNDVITAPLTSMKNFNSVIIGNNSKVTGNNNIVLGNKSSDEKLMKKTTEHDNEDENADPEDATIYILPNGSGFGGAVLNKKTGDGYLVIGNEDSSRRIAYVAAGVDDSDAANMEQLRSLAKNKISLAGDTGQTNKLELGVENLTAPNENRLKFNLTGDGNYISTAADGTRVSTSFKTDQFVADQLPVTFVNADGKKLVKMKVTNGGATTEGFYVIDDLVDGKVSAGIDPVAPSDVFLSLTNPDSGNKAGDPVKLLNLKSILALSNMPTTMSNAAAFSSDNVRVVRNMLTGAPEQGITPDPNQTPFYSISGSDLYRPVTVGDLQAIASAGITFKAATGDEVVRRLGEILTIKGGGKVFNTDFSAKNITTKTENNELIIGLKTAPDFNKITFHDGKASISNDSESNPTQFIFQGAQQSDGTYSKMKLTNLADANIVANNSDAVTGGQIFSSLKTVSSDVIAIKANNANGQAVTPKMWLDGNTATNVFLTLNDRSITETKLADAAVTKDKIANNAVTTNKIADNSIPIGKLNTTLQTTINSIGDKLDASRAQFNISDSKTNSTINLNTETAPSITVKTGNTSTLQVTLNGTDNSFTITPQTLATTMDVNTANATNLKKLITGDNLKKAIEPKFEKSRAKFNIQDDSTTTKEINLDNGTAPTVRVKGDSSVIEVKFDNTDLKVSAKVADNTAANFVNNTNQNLLATPLGVKNYIDSLKAPVTANDFGNTTSNGGKLATAQGVVNYVNANKVKYFSVNTTQDWMGNPHNDGNANNDGARGENSLVIGRASSTQRQGSLFVGNGITDSGLGNGGSWTGFNGGFVTVVGNNNTIQRPQSMFPQVEEMGITVLGSMNNIIGRTTKVFGFNNNILGPANLGIGDNLTVNGTKGENVAIIMTSMNLNNGPSADREQGISGDGNVGIGSGVLITSKTQQAGTFPVKAVAIGYDTKVYAVDSIAIGRQALGEAQGGIALGSDARTTKQGATYNSEMIKTGYNPGNTAAPSNNNTWQANRSELSLGQYDGSTGQSSITRRIANVAAGVLDADAVNVAQLKQITLGVQDDAANTPNKLYMKLYDDTNKKVNLLNMVSDTDKNVKVTVVPNENKVKFGLKPELKGITSITNTADGSTSTTGTTLTIGDAGLTLNSKKITGLQAGDISTTSNDAINGSQLNNIINKVGNKIDSVNNFAYVNATGDELVKDGNNFYKKSDLTNLARANDGKYYNKTDVNPDGSLKNTNPAPTPVAVQTQTADYISIINPDGTTTKATAMGNAKSALGLDNMPDTLAGTPITAAKAKEVVAGTDGASGLLTKTGKDLYKVATAGDLQALAQAGLDFTADDTNATIHRPLGTGLKISTSNAIGTADVNNYTSSNLGTKIDANNNVISIEMKKALTNVNSITSETNTDLVLTKGGTDKPSATITDDGLKVTTGTGTNANNILIGKDGKISGLKDGTLSSTSTDAVTGKQLKALADNINTTINNLVGTFAYTDADGNKLTKVGDKFYKETALTNYALGNDGKYYEKSKVDPLTGQVEAGATEVDLSTTVPATDQVTADKVITSAVNADGSTTSAQSLGNVASGLGLSNMNVPVNGKQANASSTAITTDAARKAVAGDNKDGKGGLVTKTGAELHKVATVGDLQALAQAGLTFTGNEGTKIKALGTELKILGNDTVTSVATGYSTTNVATKVNHDDATGTKVNIYLKETPVFKGIELNAQDTSKPNEKVTLGVGENKLTVTTGTGANEKTISIGDGKISGLANGEIAPNSTDAITGDQIQNLINKVDNQISSANNLAYVDADGNELVKDGNKFYKKSDLTNFARANDGKYYNKTDVNPDGSLKDPNATAQNPTAQTPAYVSVINPDGTVGTATPIGNVASGLGLANMPTAIGDGTGATPITVAKAKEVVAGTDGASGLLKTTGKDLYKVATVGDLQTLAQAGLDFTADEPNTTIHRPLGTGLKISTGNAIAAGSTDYTSNNLGTKINTTNNTISIEMKKALTDINSITSDANNDLVLAKGGTNKPSITINDDGLKVTTGTGTTQSNIVIGKDGKISGIKPATISSTSNEVVIGSQLQDLKDNLKFQVENIKPTMVYTDANGDRLIKDGDNFYKASVVEATYKLANDGKYYLKDKVDQYGNLTDKTAQAVNLQDVITGAGNKVDSSNVIISTVNPDGTTASSTIIGNVASGLGLDNMNKAAGGTAVSATDKQSNSGSKVIDADTARTAIAGTNKDGKGGIYTLTGTNLHKVATVGDLQAVSMAGLTFTADETKKEIHRPLGTALKIVTGTAIIETPKAGAAADPNKTPNEDKFTDANLGTRIDTADNVIGIQMKKDLTDINSITSTANTDLVLAKGGTNKPSVTINDDGLKVTTGAAGDTQSNILIGKDGKISGLKDGTIATGSTDAVTGNQIAGLTVAYKSSTGVDTTAKTVTLTNGFDFKAGSGTTGTTGTGTDAEKTKSGIVIETKANGEIVIGLDEATRKKIDETADEVSVVDGKNTKASVDTKNAEAGKIKYKVDVEGDLTDIDSLTSSQGKDLTLNKKDGSKVVLGENGINLTAGSGADAKTITINKDGTISGVTSGLKLDNTTPMDKDAAIAALNGTEDKTNPANSKPGLLGATGDALNNITTVKDLQAVAQAGLTFKTDGGEEIHRPLGSALSLTTGIKVNDSNKTNYEFANPNLGTQLNPATGTINFVFKSQPTFNGISFSGGPNGNVLNMNNQGQLFITKDGKDELLGINVKKFDGKSYFVPLNGTIEFKDTANVVADVTGKTESTLAPAGLTGGTGGTSSVASPTSGSTSLSTGSAFFDGVDTTTDAKPPASTTVDATVEWKIPDNAPIKITVDENNMKDDQIVNKKYVDSKLGPVVNNMTQITNHINVIRQESNAGIASAFAASHVPQVINTSDRNLVGVGFGSYHGANAVAIGLSGTNRSRTVVWKLTGTYDSSNSFGIGAGLGFSYGPKNRYKDEENNVLKPAKLNDFNERITRQQIEIDTLKDFIKDMQEQHKAEIEELKNQIKTMQTH